MEKQPILEFLFNYLSDLNLSYTIAPGCGLTLADLDNGLRNSILKLLAPAVPSTFNQIKNNTVYHIIDYYECNYSFFHFPEQKEFLFIGPYLKKLMTEEDIQTLMSHLSIPQELFPQLCDYYSALPYISDSHSLQLLLRHVYDTLFHSKITEVCHIDLKEIETREEYINQHQFIVSENPILSMQLLEKRYATEDALLDAVAHGNTAKALSFSENIRAIRIQPRTDNQQRDQKNLMITLNTLLRRTVYTCGVHSFYINEISSNFVRLIEQCESISKLEELSLYMIKSYCALAQKHNMASYSEPVRQILVTIDASLTADLSLKRFANDLYLNTSYLSALFKKEVGITLTDYVNKSRIAHAKKLLKSTTLSVQNIAGQSGFSDIHYFNRLFRRETGISPREWRNQS